VRRAHLLLLLVTGCSSKATGTIAIDLGGEVDALTRAPAPTSLLVETLDLDGGATTLATIPLPAGGTVDLGDRSQDQSGSVRITGKDATGTLRVWGQSLPFDFGSLAATTLGVFVQRTGEWARMPGSLGDTREGPIATTVIGRYLLAAGGADASKTRTTALYDLLTLRALPYPPSLPRDPGALAISGPDVLVVDGAGASLFDLTASTTTDVAAPAGGTYAEVLGGASVLAPDGTSYLVGAARATGGPTARVLVIDPTGHASFAALSAARAGAAVAYAAGRGLVVFGGTALAPAIEVLAPGATAATAASFPPNATSGAAATALDGDHVLVAWGRAGDPNGSFLALDLAHPDPSATPVSAPLPCAAKHLDLFALDPTHALGIAEDGDSCAFVWDGKSAATAPLRVPRRGARGVRLPNGAIGVVGGSATVESFATGTY
jgi:hypothetical protein